MSEIPISPIIKTIQLSLEEAKLLGDPRNVVLRVTAAQAWAMSLAINYYRDHHEGIVELHKLNEKSLYKSTHISVPDEIPE